MGNIEGVEKDVDFILSDLCLGTAEVLIKKDLKDKLAVSLQDKKPLRIKAGFDPTASDLHLGHTVILNLMAKFQAYGHDVLFLIGDFTGRIGDPTGRSETRKPLSELDVKSNAETYKQQVFKVLDPGKTQVVFNSAWLSKLDSTSFIKLASTHTVAQMLEREDFARRHREGLPISIHEFLYPLLQGYDSVELRSDVELGGTDQKFNLLVGRELQRLNGQSPQTVMMTALLEGTDGIQKMSKSLGNFIAIQDPPKEMFGKVMRISDELMLKYYELISLLPIDEVQKIKLKLQEGHLHPKAAKVNLAKILLTRFHSKAEADRQAEEFEKVFSQKQLPDEMKMVSVKSSALLSLLQVGVAQGLAESNTKLRKLAEQGGLYVNGERVTDPSKFIFDSVGEYVVKAGKRHFLKVVTSK